MLKSALLAIAATLVATATAQADDAYPSKPVKVVIGFAVGGPTDVIARVVAKDLTTRLGQSFVVENRPGANSMIATELVSRAPADGYTLLMSTLAHNVNAIIAVNAGLGPKEFGAWLREDFARWERVIKAANISGS